MSIAELETPEIAGHAPLEYARSHLAYVIANFVPTEEREASVVSYINAFHADGTYASILDMDEYFDTPLRSVRISRYLASELHLLRDAVETKSQETLRAKGMAMPQVPTCEALAEELIGHITNKPSELNDQHLSPWPRALTLTMLDAICKTWEI